MPRPGDVGSLGTWEPVRGAPAMGTPAPEPPELLGSKINKAFQRRMAVTQN